MREMFVVWGILQGPLLSLLIFTRNRWQGNVRFQNFPDRFACYTTSELCKIWNEHVNVQHLQCNWWSSRQMSLQDQLSVITKCLACVNNREWIWFWLTRSIISMTLGSTGGVKTHARKPKALVCMCYVDAPLAHWGRLHPSKLMKQLFSM